MQTVLKVMPLAIREGLNCLTDRQQASLQEIRLRINMPVLLKMQEGEYGLNQQGLCQVEESLSVSAKAMKEIIQAMSGFSLYAIEEELKQGYLTLEGGHRVGLVGKVVMAHHEIKTLKYISAMNIRIAHEVVGCSKAVMPYLLTRNQVYRTLIISPPGCGKTTLLRDIIRALSEGYHGYGPFTIGVVDERSELAACYQGIPQNHLGKRTDVLDGCPKTEGMRMLLRAMAPQVVAVDEIGKEEECGALREMLNAGVAVLCTAHGQDEKECLKRPALGSLMSEGLFERIIVLSRRNGPCTLEKLLDGTRQMKSLL